MRVRWLSCGDGGSGHHDGVRDQFRSGADPDDLRRLFYGPRLGEMDRPHRCRAFRHQFRFHRTSDEHLPALPDLRYFRRVCAELCLFGLPQQHDPLFPGLVMDNFGPANQGVNYGIVFIGFSSAAFVAPKVTASLAAANNGDFTKAFYVAIAVVLLGLGLSLIYAKRKTAAHKLRAEIAQ